MDQNKITSKLIHYYLNDSCFVKQCCLAIENRLAHLPCYCNTEYFLEIKKQYSDLRITNIQLDNFLEGIRSDKNELLSCDLFFYESGIKARNLKSFNIVDSCSSISDNKQKYIVPSS
jgi:hypothetical protein